MKKRGFGLLETIIIIIITALVASLTTGIILYNSYKNNTGLTYEKLTQDKALQEFLEVYTSVTSEYYQDIDKTKMLEKAISAMMNYLDDNYTSYLTEEETEDLADKLAGEYRGIGISIQDNVIVEVFKDSPAEKIGLKVNDKIIEVNGENVEKKTAKEIAALIKKNSETVTIKIKRAENYLTFSPNFSELYIPAINYELKEKNVGYIYIGTFSNTLADQMSKALKNLKEQKMEKLIIDVRNNVGGYLTAASDVANLFLEEDKVIYSLQDSKGTKTYKDTTKTNQNIPIVVLMNENSASASEILIAALKESYNATLVGTTSYGKGKVQQTKTLSDGSMVKYTSAKWLTPKGNCIDEKGIEPDYKIELEYKYNEAGEIESYVDTQLAKALEIINK